MKKLTWTWKKIVALIAGFFGIGTLVSCYGVVPFLEEVTVSGNVTGEIEGEIKPVPGIFVKGEMGNHTYTDENGDYTIQAYRPGSLWFIDVDDEKNGSFDEKYVYIIDAVYGDEELTDEVALNVQLNKLGTSEED